MERRGLRKPTGLTVCAITPAICSLSKTLPVKTGLASRPNAHIVPHSETMNEILDAPAQMEKN